MSREFLLDEMDHIWVICHWDRDILYGSFKLCPQNVGRDKHNLTIVNLSYKKVASLQAAALFKDNPGNLQDVFYLIKISYIYPSKMTLVLFQSHTMLKQCYSRQIVIKFPSDDKYN